MRDETDYYIDNTTNQTNYVLPFSNYDNQSIMAIAGFYALLFILGTCGNSAILAVVHHVRSSDSRARHNTTLIYICVLSIVDFISMLPLPTTIIDQILGFWMFGTLTCKLFRLFEHIGKIFSTFILVCLSFDRYCAVCHPLQAQLRTSRVAHLMLTILFGFTCVMLAPIAIYARSKEIIIFERYNNITRELTVLHLYKCVDDLGKDLFVIFSLSCFIIAYLLPLILMVYFYNGMLWRLFKQTRVVRKAYSGKQNPISRIAIYTLAICLFHFVCWTPYWISVLYSLYLEVFLPPDEALVPSPAFIYFMYGVHALPYINSASNFILYGLLNRQLHQSGNDKNRRSSFSGCHRSVMQNTRAVRGTTDSSEFPPTGDHRVNEKTALIDNSNCHDTMRNGTAERRNSPLAARCKLVGASVGKSSISQATQTTAVSTSVYATTSCSSFGDVNL